MERKDKPEEEVGETGMTPDEQASKVGDLGRGSQEETHTGTGASPKDPAERKD